MPLLFLDFYFYFPWFSAACPHLLCLFLLVFDQSFLWILTACTAFAYCDKPSGLTKPPLLMARSVSLKRSTDD